jgi:hypothetical protein
VAGLVVLGLLGTAGEGTNLVAHALGFVMGGAAGAVVSQPRAASRLRVIPQWAAGLIALATVLGAWRMALTG